MYLSVCVEHSSRPPKWRSKRRLINYIIKATITLRIKIIYIFMSMALNTRIRACDTTSRKCQQGNEKSINLDNDN